MVLADLLVEFHVLEQLVGDSVAISGRQLVSEIRVPVRIHLGCLEWFGFGCRVEVDDRVFTLLGD